MPLIDIFTTLLSWASTTTGLDVINKHSMESVKHILSQDMCCLVPSLSLLTTYQDNFPKVRSPEGAGSLRNHLIQKLSTHLKFTKFDISDAAKTLHDNLIESFTHLVESRIKNMKQAFWTHALMLNTNDSYVPTRLLQIDDFFETTTAVTAFSVPPGVGNTIEIDDCISMPLLFEATIDVTIFEGQESLSLSFKVPGSIAGSFTQDCFGNKTSISNVAINLETSILLDSMVRQAKHLAKKSFQVALATLQILELQQSISLISRHGTGTRIECSSNTASETSEETKMQSRSSDNTVSTQEEKNLNSLEIINSPTQYSQDALDAANGLRLLCKKT